MFKDNTCLDDILIYNASTPMSYIVSEFYKVGDILFCNAKWDKNIYKRFPVNIVKVDNLV